MRPDPVLLGVFSAGSPPVADLTGALEGLGTVAELRGGALHAAAAGPARTDLDLEAAPCLLDGEIVNLDAVAPGTGAPETRLHAAWRREGDTWLASLRGPFALLLWDGVRRRGVLARDLLGQRPVLFHTAGGQCHFATELEPLCRVLPRRPVPDELTVARWIANGHDFGARTLFAGVRRLGQGEALVFEPGGARVTRFTDFAPEAPLAGSPDEVAELIREEAARAVRRSIGTHARPGVTLSGGLDSNLLAGLAARDGVKLRAYSTVFPTAASIDEESLIRETVDRLGLDWTPQRITQGRVVAGVLEFLAATGAPTLSVTGGFWPALLRAADEDGVGVVLDGEGGDELFLTRFPAVADALANRDPRRAWDLVTGFPTIGDAPGRRLRAELLMRHGVLPLMPEPLIRPWEDRLGLLRRRPALRVAAARPAVGWKRLDGPRAWAFAADVFRTYCDGRGIAEHLARVARLGGVRERHPLLDEDLVRLVLRLPDNFTFSAQITRPMQRTAMAGLVPESVRMRTQKSYFSELAVQSVLEADAVVIRDLLGHDARIGAWVRRSKLEALLVPPPGPDRGAWALQVLDLVRIETWLREQEHPGWAARTAASLVPDA